MPSDGEVGPISAQDKYFEALHKGLGLGGYHAVWPPGQPVALGAIGAMVGRAFDPRGYLQDFVSIEPDHADDKPEGLTYGNEHGIDVALQAAAGTGAVVQALTDVNLSVRVTFKAKDQVALRAVGVSYERVRDTRRFAESVIDAFNNGHVEYGDVFVNGMIVAESGAAAVSGTAGATVDLTGNGDVAPGGTVGLFSLKGGISIANSTGTSLSVPMSKGFVVAIRLVSLDRKGVFRVRPIVVDLPTFTEDLEFEREYELTFEETSAVSERQSKDADPPTTSEHDRH